VRNSRKKITCGDFKVVQYAVKRTGRPGEWTKSENHCQFRAENGAILNYWKSTGTITFQGPELAAAGLKATFLKRVAVLKHL
jgi:hypothetical protein